MTEIKDLVLNILVCLHQQNLVGETDISLKSPRFYNKKGCFLQERSVERGVFHLPEQSWVRVSEGAGFHIRTKEL